MEDFNFKDLSPDTFYTIGSIIAGIFYGFKKVGKKDNNSTNETQSDLIEILRQHVEDEDEKNKYQQSEIKELKSTLDELEDDLQKNKKTLRKYESFVDNLKYYCPYLPNIDEYDNFDFKQCSLSHDCFKLKYCSQSEKRKQTVNKTSHKRRSTDKISNKSSNNEKKSNDNSDDFYIDN